MANNRELSQFGSFVEVADSTKLGIGASVGIGTTLPTVQLEVHGDVKTVSGKVGVQTAASVDLQVYGQTQLDDLNVLGIATFTGAIDANGGLNISGGSALVASSLKVSDLTDNRVVIAGGSGELEDDSRFTFDGSNLTVGLSSGATISKDGDLTLTGVAEASTAGPSLKLFRNSASPADADYIGEIKFNGENDNDEEVEYVKISGKILDASDGTEDGILEFEHLKAGSEVVTARFRSDSVQLVNGTNLSVNGDLDVDGDTALDNVTVSLASTFTGIIDGNGGANISGGSGLVASSAKVSDLTDNNIVVAGVSGQLEGDTNFTYDTMKVGISTDLLVTGVATFSQGINLGAGQVAITTNSITGPAQMFIDPAAVGDNTGSVRIKGDLYVDGTTTQINSTTLEIADFIVGIATTATSDSLADGAGIQIGPSGNTFLYDNTNEAFTSSENLNVASGHTYKIAGTDVLSATTLGSNVVNSSLTSVGTLGGLTVGANGINVSGVVTATAFSGVDTDKISEGNTEVETVDTGSDGHVKITTEGVERLRVHPGGMVAIGTASTTSASTNFDDLIVGNHAISGKRTGITIVSANNQDGAICFSKGTGGSDRQRGQIAYMHDPSTSSNEYLDFYVAMSQRLRIDGDGRLLAGLNAANSQLASAKLQIVGGNDANNIAIINSSASDDDGARSGNLFFRGSQSGNEKSTLAAITASHDGASDDQKGDLILKTNDGSDGDTPTERLRIDSNGDLQVGNISNLVASGAGKLNILADNTTNLGIATDGAINIACASGAAVGRVQSINWVPGFNVTLPTASIGHVFTNAGGYGQGDLFFATRGATTNTAATERLRITSTGWQKGHAEYDGVGINTFASWARTGGAIRAEVGYNAVTADYMYFGTGTDHPLALRVNNSNALYIKNDASRSVGIGTDNPSGHLQIGSAGGSHVIITENIGVDINDGAINLYQATSNVNAAPFIISTDVGGTETEKLRVTGGGNVGINSSSPAVKLDIRSTDAIRVPVGTTGQRPTGAAGYIRYNSSIGSYEGHNGSEWAGIGGAAEKETSVSSTNATSCETFSKTAYRSASIIAQITQGSNYQVGNYLVIHDGTTATVVEESAVATGDMLGTFTVAVLGSDVAFLVNMASSASATVTTKMTKVSIP